MTRTLEAPNQTPYVSNEEALEIVDRYRHRVGERRYAAPIEAVEAEFPFLEKDLDGTAVYLARLGDNNVGAFKWRGAFVGAEALVNAGHKQIYTVSAGNAGAGAAEYARLNPDVDMRIIVPETAARQKKDRIRKLGQGASVQLIEIGSTFDEAYEWAKENEEGYWELPPFDSQSVSAGHGTIVKDIQRQIGDPDIIISPAGGLGLVSGILKNYEGQVHIVEAEGSNSTSLSMEAGYPVEADQPNQRHGGSAVKIVGQFGLKTVLANRDRVTMHTATDQEVRKFASDYEQHREDNWLRGHVENYESTTLVPISKLADIAREYASNGERVVVLGTGHNDSLDSLYRQN
jgi:threonine dehydratase